MDMRGQDLIRQLPGSPNPYDRHNASVSQKVCTDVFVEKPFIDRLQTAKREKHDFPTALQTAYTVVNLIKLETLIIKKK